MEEDDVAGSKGAKPGQRGQPVLPWLACRLSTRRNARRRGVVALGQNWWMTRLVQLVTSDPIRSPSITRRMFPGWFMLKMIMGILLSLQRLTAVMSITFNPSRIISM